jgi:hypothetical protein
MARTYRIKPFEQAAAYSSDRSRYFQYAEQTLEELLPIAAEVQAIWPPDAPLGLQVGEGPPELHRLGPQARPPL